MNLFVHLVTRTYTTVSASVHRCVWIHVVFHAALFTAQDLQVKVSVCEQQSLIFSMMNSFVIVCLRE